jgi:ABC-type spermidine/putrescine transport system permease subunit II
VLIVLPSVVSAIGVLFVIVGVVVDQVIIRAVFLSVGISLLWTDMFLTMAIMRRSLRNIDRRLRRIESRLNPPGG